MLWQTLWGHRSAWFPLLSAGRFIEFDTSIICHALVHCFDSSLLQDMFLRSPRICFWGAKYGVHCDLVAYLHSISWRRARLWLELFASTVDKFLSQVSYFPSYVLLQRRHSFTSRKLYARLGKFLCYLQLSDWAYVSGARCRSFFLLW